MMSNVRKDVPLIVYSFHRSCVFFPTISADAASAQQYRFVTRVRSATPAGLCYRNKEAIYLATSKKCGNIRLGREGKTGMQHALFAAPI